MRLRWGAALALAWLAGWAEAVQSNNHVLHAVPPPRSTGSGQAGKVVLDGRLDDWDLSGQLEVFAHARMKNTYSARVAAMYDAENLYLAIVWRDPTPLFNLVDARFDIGSGWRSDCLQLRLRTDLVMHVDCWYSTAAGRPVVNIAYGRFSSGRDAEDVNRFEPLPDAIQAGAQEGFAKGEDGKSYTQEIALPWRLITAQGAKVKETGKPYKEPLAFKAGDRFSMGMEFLWGGPDGKTWPVHRYADLLKEGTSSREFFWTAENSWGTVVLEPKGNLALPREAAAGEDPYLQKTEGPVALRYTMPYDGFATLVIEDTAGRRVRNLVGVAPRAKGERTDFWDGVDEHGQLVAPGEYRWRGLIHQGVDAVYEASYGTPGVPPWDNADNTGAWMSDHNPPCAVAAIQDRVVLGASGSEGGWALVAVDLEGRKKWGERKFQGIRALDTDGTHVYCGMNMWAQYGVEAPPPQVGRCELKAGAYAPFESGAQPQLVVEVAAADEKARLTGLAVSSNQLAVSLAGPNVVRFLDKRTAARVRDVAVPEPAGLDFAPSGDLLVISGKTVVRLDGDKPVAVVSAGLEQPVDLAVAADGTVYVADRGLNQVRVFRADGQLVRTLGCQGGRPQPGPWVADSLRAPAGLDLDSRGRLWVAEEDMLPKRISVWNADGTFALDLLGPTTYGGMGAFVDPDDKTRVFGSGCEWKLDYAANKAVPVATRFAPADFGWAVAGGVLLKRGGHEYFLCKRNRLFVRRGEGFALCALAGQVDEPAVAALEREKPGKLTHNFLWSDRNDDGRIQSEEVSFRPLDIAWNAGYWGGLWLDEQFNAVFSPGGYGRVQAVRLPLAGWSKGGVPRWDAEKVEAWSDQPVPGGPGKLLLGDAQRGVIIAGYTPITAVRADGRVAWTYANPWNDVHGSHSAPVPESDATIVGLLSCIGTADAGAPLGRLFAMNSNMGRLYVMTTDGLLAATVFQDVRVGADAWPNKAETGAPLGGTSMGGEWFGGFFFRSRQNEYYLIAGGTSYNLIRLNGLESVRALDGGALAFTGEQLAAADALQRRKAGAQAVANALTIARLAKPAVADGALDEYPKQRAVEWSSGPYRARGVVAVDGANLCVAWQVFGDTSPMANAGKDATQLFLTGDSVDLQLGTDAGADPKRTDPVPGDLRLLVSEQEGKPVAVLYRWKTAGEKKPQEFRSPWRAVTVESVEVVADAQVKINRQGDGYTVEAVVPLQTLGFTPQAEKTYKLDLGVIYSNAEGNNRAARVYWSNKATGLVSDVPGEIMASPNLWGTATVETL
jgi:hypothetical protein